MAGIHALIGIGEGLITIGTLAFLHASRKDLLVSRETASKRGGLVWVAGLRPAETVKVTEASRTLLTLEIRPSRPETRRIWEMILACRGQGT